MCRLSLRCADNSLFIPVCLVEDFTCYPDSVSICYIRDLVLVMAEVSYSTKTLWSIHLINHIILCVLAKKSITISPSFWLLEKAGIVAINLVGWGLCFPPYISILAYPASVLYWDSVWNLSTVRLFIYWLYISWLVPAAAKARCSFGLLTF